MQDPRTGNWAAVPSLPDTLTINIGDLMARWTNDRWRATRHRVQAPPAGSAAAACGRLSLVYFTGPNPSMPVQCLPSAKCDCENSKYPSIRSRRMCRPSCSPHSAAPPTAPEGWAWLRMWRVAGAHCVL